ncbi:MAG TPA: POTRA domain-containing protein [Candidatus Dormibacteraeota bacterium]|nr:POTRA domain-containing protein [Candidatus Dormibacteraeota bacterium]
MLICLAALVQVFCSLAVLPQAQLAPASQPKKGKITSIKIKGLQSYPEVQVLTVTRLHAGDFVAKEDLQAAADHLLQLGLFSTANYSFKSRGEDLDVTFDVAEASSVAVSFDNIPWYTDAELIDAIQKSVPLFVGRAPQQGALVDEISAALQNYLALRNPALSVAHDLINDPATDEPVQQFRVKGAGLTIGRIELGHALAAQSRSVQAHLATLVGKPFSRFAISLFLSEHVRPIYLEQGHLRARFRKPEVRFSGNPAKPPETVQVIVPIEPGPVFHWGGARWSGNRALTAESLDGLLALRTNELASGNSINAALERVEDEYGRRGYIDAKLPSNIHFDDSKAIVRYDITVSEGPQYHMGEMVITGLSLAAERRLRAGWPIPPGTVFDRTKYEALLMDLQKQHSEFFGELPVHYDEVGHWLRPDPARATVDVLLDFK